MQLQISKDGVTYNCDTYDYKVTSPALEMTSEDGLTIKYVGIGNNSNNTPIMVGSQYILTQSKHPTPSIPRITDSGYGAVEITSDEGTYIVFNGETKDSGSWWYYNGTEILDLDAYAYHPADDYGLQSDNSESLNIKILGSPTNLGSDGDNSAKLSNANDIDVLGYAKSTVRYITNGYINVGYLNPSKYDDLYISQGKTLTANTYMSIMTAKNVGDGFDNDENRVGGQLNGNTYYWFEKSGYYPSAMSRLDFVHKDYHIDTWKYDNSGLLSWGDFTYSSHKDYDDHDNYHDHHS